MTPSDRERLRLWLFIVPFATEERSPSDAPHRSKWRILFVTTIAKVIGKNLYRGNCGPEKRKNSLDIRQGEIMGMPRDWDERDYHLWSAIYGLPSYGLVNGDRNDCLISRKKVFDLMELAAKARVTERHVHRVESAPGDSGAGEKE